MARARWLFKHLVVLLAVSTSSLLALQSNARAVSSRVCQRLLTETAPYRIVVDLRTLPAIVESSEALSLALKRLSPESQIWNDEYRLSNIFGLSAHLLHKLHKQFQIDYRNNPELKAEYERFNESGAPGKYNFHQVFNQPESPRLYKRFVSAMQRYFSTTLVAYAMSRSALNPDAELQALDLGAGVGDTTFAIRTLFHHARVTAFDKSAPLLEQLAREPFTKVTTMQGDFEQPLEIKNNSYHLVTMVCSGNQYLDFPSFKRLLIEIKRVLKPGGFVVFEFAPWNYERFGQGYPTEFLAEMQTLGFITEEQIGIRLKIGNNDYYPILLQKPLRSQRR